jgi:ribonucleoside-triphosphate reductase
MFEFKWTPPGRGIWIMGTQFMYERGGAALNNCGFVSTRNINVDFCDPFLWVFRMSMLGVGVGFDTRGKGKVTILKPVQSNESHTIEDSREGWAGALERLLLAYMAKGTLPQQWDFNRIRPKGSRLNSIGGHASGREPLNKMLASLKALYNGYIERHVDSALIVDTMNIIGRCVVAGGIRRSAQIALGDVDDTQFLDLKSDKQKTADYRWVSNNSIFARVGMEYTRPAERTVSNGEPGYFWLENARAFGRMKDPPNGADEAAEGSNPCVEQTLWDRELCCLVETYPAHHTSLDDYLTTLRIAYEYAKTVTLIPTHDDRTNAIMLRNRRIGCSMTGVVQAIEQLGEQTFFKWCERAYREIQRWDEQCSERLNVPRSIKTTSVKPSGTVSLLAGATPGVHWGYAPYYLRRIRLSDGHALVTMCREAGYPIEPDAYSDSTVVVAFPVRTQGLERKRSAVSIAEKIALAAKMQEHWSDNQVSCTVEFNPDTESDEVPRVLGEYENRLKAISFLPADTHGYEQPPYEEITHQQYAEMMASLKPLRGTLDHEQQLESRFCDGEECETIPVQ